MLITYKVSELVNNIKITLEENFPLIELIGEVSEVRPNLKSGHIYFKLRDKKAAVSCVLWKNLNLLYGKFIEEGKELKLRGRITAYNTTSNFYLHTVAISLSKEGDIKQYIKELTQKLTQEGIFNESHKQVINRYPNCIGIITSKDGAVFGDIKASLYNRYPTKIKLYDVAVQGSESIASIIKAINYFNQETTVDFIIIARGGGSNDDLFHFNDETLVRTIHDSKIPIITAIGHELNCSLADRVADLTVVTPTASVALIPLVIDLREKIDKALEDINLYFKHKIYSNTKALNTTINYLINPKDRLVWLQEELHNNLYKVKYSYKILLKNKQDQVNNWLFYIKQDIYNNYLLWSEKLHSIEQIIESLSINATLKRGFVLLQQNDAIVKNKKTLKEGEYKIEFYDGQHIVDIKLK